MIEFRYDGIPPTSNHAYVTLRNLRRVPSTAGKKYVHETQVTTSKQALFKRFDAQDVYALVYKVVTPTLDLYTKGYPKTAKNRVQGWDISNRCKIFEDAFKKGIGIDDSNFFVVVGAKVDGGEDCKPTTLAYVWSLTDPGEGQWSIDKILRDPPNVIRPNP